jgi:predicted DNA-binding transcriptional regulator AlpA
MRQELQTALNAARQTPREELPRLLGELEEIRFTAIARLTPAAPSIVGPDDLLDVDQAASRLGMSKDYLYRHHTQFPFARRVGRRSVRFSARGIEEYIKAAKSY